MSTLSAVKYFRDALTAQVNHKIDFKSMLYEILNIEDVKKGQLNPSVFFALKKLEIQDEGYEDLPESELKPVNIILSYKTMKTHFLNACGTKNDIDELTGVFFISGELNSEGTLKFDLEKTPWIPREFLSPMCDPVLSLGSQVVFDNALTALVGMKHQIKTWEEYINYCEKLFELTQLSAVKESNDFEKDIFIFEDETVNAIQHVKSLYNDLVDLTVYNKLLDRFLRRDAENSRELVPFNLEVLSKHKGQMNGSYPLSESQRESMAHLSQSCEGDILAVSGPPGTGKTTLLQSIVADLIVERALKRANAPVIVGASTNNQAVTNIIDSFKSIQTISDNAFEKRWIIGVTGLATYLPSKSKIESSLKAGIQADNTQGQYFFDQLDSDENRQASKAFFFKQYELFIGKKLLDIKTCQNDIHKLMTELDHFQIEFLKLYNLADEKSFCLATIEEDFDHFSKEKLQNESVLFSYKKRIKEWRDYYSGLPIYLRWFKWLPSIKRRLDYRLSEFIMVEETFLTAEISLEIVEIEYSKMITQTRNRIQHLQELLNEIEQLQKMRDALKASSNELLAPFSRLFDKPVKIDFAEKDLQSANTTLDQTIRYFQLWLAVHYFEAGWLMNSNPLSDKQKKSNIVDVQIKRLNQYAQLTPCFVSTFYMLPKHFSGYSMSEQRVRYLRNFIDLLIVDEAGQVTPEVAACSFVLAKKAVVVGDEHQIAPVYSINNGLDLTLTDQYLDNCVNEGQPHPFLNSSSSSVMRIASMQCHYEKYGHKGLFLKEHRRCLDEIIGYCNDLVYEGRLEPKRGDLGSLRTYPENIIKPMMHIQVNSSMSQKMGSSRYNTNEADAIAKWIKANFNELVKCYEKVETKNLIGIITPFKAQVAAINYALRTIAPEFESQISVGTVHTFQGAERTVILFSTVYGSDDNGCYFIDASPSLMNVAVSRAKDAFIVFGDNRCFSSNLNTPSGLLRKYTL